MNTHTHREQRKIGQSKNTQYLGNSSNFLYFYTITSDTGCTGHLKGYICSLGDTKNSLGMKSFSKTTL